MGRAGTEDTKVVAELVDDIWGAVTDCQVSVHLGLGQPSLILTANPVHDGCA